MAFLDETGLAELWSLICEKVDGLTADDVGAVKVVTGSYTGTGEENYTRTLTFGFMPRLVIVTCAEVRLDTTSGWIIYINGVKSNTYVCDSYSSNYRATIYFTVTDTGVNIRTYASTGNPAGDRRVFNNSGKTYNYVAIG